MFSTPKPLSAGRLRDREERFRTTVDQAPVGISHTDAKGRWLYVNEKFCDMVGYSKEELLSRTFAEITHPDYISQNEELDRKLFAGEIDHFSFEKQYIKKNGEPVWVHLTVSLVRSHDGHPAYTIGIIEDITERKLQTKALRTAEKLLAAGKLAANIAHELNNPIAAMFNLVYILKSDPSIQGSSREAADQLDEQLRRIAEVTKRSLAFYRESTVRESVDVGSIMREVLHVFEARLTAARIQTQRTLEPSEPVAGFPGELRHTFANFITNAMDELEFQPEPRLLNITIRNGFAWKSPALTGVRVSISDNGSGIPRSSWPTLYDAFFTTKGRGANGLGLWVAKGIIEKHGGGIRFRTSRSGRRRGTFFSIFLPRVSSCENQHFAAELAKHIGRELLRDGTSG
ncbi:MAG: two-component system sensor histidine kinase NtrB [Acidobacteriaceae bacterium]